MTRPDETTFIESELYESIAEWAGEPVGPASDLIDEIDLDSLDWVEIIFEVEDAVLKEFQHAVRMSLGTLQSLVTTLGGKGHKYRTVPALAPLLYDLIFNDSPS